MTKKILGSGARFKRLQVVLLVASILSLSYLSYAAISMSDEGALLFVSQDESTLERKIAKYIESVHGITAGMRYVNDNEDDLYLVYKIGNELQGIPTAIINVDTMPSNTRESDDHVMERVVMIRMYYIVPDHLKTKEFRAKLLELNNDHMINVWVPGGVYLDKDMDVRFQTSINIPHADLSIHAEMIYDMLARYRNSWEKYYQEFGKLILEDA